MKHRLIIDGNAVYEVDEECMRRKRKMESQNMNQKLQQNAKSNDRSQEDGE